MNLLEYLQYYFTRLSNCFSAITPRNNRIHTENNNESERDEMFSVYEGDDSTTDQEQENSYTPRNLCDQNTDAFPTNPISVLVGTTGS
ncbi:MAG: hypothetical protein K9G11_02710 [Rickettsiaceae bacterium]|nr:hypothetical protein [Rickettsiaceae bacterium]